MMRLGHLPTEEELKKMVAEVDQVCKLVDGQTIADSHWSGCQVANTLKVGNLFLGHTV